MRGEGCSLFFLDLLAAHEPTRLLSRPSGTLSSTRSGGEGWGEEAFRFMGSVLLQIDLRTAHEPLRSAEPLLGANPHSDTVPGRRPALRLMAGPSPATLG